MAGPVGSAVGVLTGVAVGGAATVALEPAFEIPRQDAWSRNANRILDTNLLARLVAQGGLDLSSAQDEAKREGFAPDKLDALVYLAQTVPGVSEAMSLWRKGLIGDALFSHVLVKAGLDQRYAAPLMNMKEAELIGLGDIATAIVRGAVPAPSWVPVAPPTQTDAVPRFPVTNIDPVALAAKLGFDEDMLRIMTARSGLSLAPILATQALFRGALSHNDWLLAIAEGDLRTEWAETLRAAARQIPSTHTFVQGHLRGWIGRQAMYDGAARHGQSQADTDLEYQVERRPLTPHQIKQALARGATFDTANAPMNDPYLASVHEANLGPEWYDMAISLQGSYPSLFQMNRLVSAAVIDANTAADWMRKAGQADEVVAALHTYWSNLGGGGTDPHVAKAQTQLWTTTHRSYVQGEIDDAAATTALEAAGVAPAAVPQILTLWREERALVRKQLTPAQIKKAAAEGVPNPATGQPWNITDAVARLISLGMSANDARTFMEL